MTEPELRVDVRLRIVKPAEEVYEAIVNPEQMSRYFTSSGSGRLDAGKPVTWKWDDFGAQATVTPQSLEANRKVSFLWSAAEVATRVTMELNRDDADATTVKVSESGWPLDAAGTERCMQQTQGWMHMLCCLKAYLEYGINLRKGGVAK